MEALQLVGMGVAAAILSLMVRESRPDMALLISLAAGVMLLGVVLSRFSQVLALLGDLAARARLTEGYLLTIIRVMGVAYLAEFGVQICRDAGAGGVAAKVELGGKLIILAMAAPIVASLVDTVTGMLQ
ncbi:MAG: stage III sporulation protein AD [Oscillospiraceae bacterium]|jgi:stage III sporulation protein AD|nr:stage III sporulation protein AD [Oscillospiraceae bacterium]